MNPRDDSTADLDVETAYAEGLSAWPGVRLPFERFAERCRAADVAADDLVARSVDLYLAYACAQNEPRAVAHFERLYLGQVAMYVRRFSLSPDLLDELLQKIRVKLLVGSPPPLVNYRGQGPLGGFVRVTAVRLATDLLGRGSGPGNADTNLLDALASLDEGPEVAAMRSRYRERFRAALEESLGSLSSRQKTLLRLHLVDGLGPDALTTIFRVHRATIARWMIDIRTKVAEDLRRSFGLGAPMPSAELRSLIGLLKHDLNLSARRLLAG